jgi:hypothetical protein
MVYGTAPSSTVTSEAGEYAITALRPATYYVRTERNPVPFEYAARVFLDDARRDAADTRRDYGEQRRIALGEIEGRVFAVAYTFRGKVIRLISARKGNERERRRYHETLPA